MSNAYDESLAERCYCVTYTDKPAKTFAVNVYPNPSKGLFYIDIPDYTGSIIMKISSASGKLLQTHHLMYSGLISWRLSQGVWSLSFTLNKNQKITEIVVIQ